MLQLALPLALALSTLPAPQGAVWVVDANAGAGHDFVQIRDAVSAASDGDTVLVRSGVYTSFPIFGKALNVIADEGAQVSVNTFPGFFAPMTLGGTPAGSTTVLRGLEFFAPIIDPFTFTQYCMSLYDCEGTVWIEDCEFLGGQTTPVWIQNCGDIVMERCTADPAGFPTSSILASGVRLTIHGGSYTGGPGNNGGIMTGDASPGSPGIHLQAGELYLSGCDVVGGPGGSGGFSGCPSSPPDGGPGVRADVGQVRVLDAAVNGGAPGSPPFGCDPASTGPRYQLGTATLTQLAGTASSLTSNSPVREGQTLTLTLATESGQQLTALLLAGQATDPIFSAPLAGVGLLGGPTRRIALGSVDPLTGLATVQIPIADLGPGVLVAPWIFQGYVCGSGGCTAGAATHTVWLDSSL